MSRKSDQKSRHLHGRGPPLRFKWRVGGEALGHSLSILIAFYDLCKYLILSFHANIFSLFRITFVVTPFGGGGNSKRVVPLRMRSLIPHTLCIVNIITTNINIYF